ncbi:MAG TPA: sialidase family protein, partial [Ramlibacter sp.]|nr:sialidase family protein [Ramlibacter sp.]
YDLLVAPGGRAFAAWTEYDGPLWFTSSTDGGRSFAPPARVAGAARGSKPLRGPALALAPDGAVLLAWTEGDNPAADIHVARSPDGVRFGPPVVVGRSRGYSDAPRLAVDARGTVHLAYAEAAGGPFTAQRVHYASSSDSARSFGAPRVLTDALPAPWTSASHPGLEVDAAGRLYVLFELQDDLRKRPRALGLSVSTDGGNRFTPPEAVPHSRDPRGGFNGSTQGLLMRKLAVRPDGELVVANSALLEDSHSRVWLVRGRVNR